MGDLETDRHLFWIAEKGLKEPLPPPWKPREAKDSDVFYFNFETGESVWDHPIDEQMRKLYQEHKEKKEEKSRGKETAKDGSDEKERVEQKKKKKKEKKEKRVCNRDKKKEKEKQEGAAAAATDLTKAEEGKQNITVMEEEMDANYEPTKQ